mmetsp:Transcript_71988/g.116716  ORF Transcript_71988/g.116716 Transcript_71988/m.116716 type:complete len:295 (-) Transcript_71988:985-1869(-)
MLFGLANWRFTLVMRVFSTTLMSSPSTILRKKRSNTVLCHLQSSWRYLSISQSDPMFVSSFENVDRSFCSKRSSGIQAHAWGKRGLLARRKASSFARSLIPPVLISTPTSRTKAMSMAVSVACTQSKKDVAKTQSRSTWPLLASASRFTLRASISVSLNSRMASISSQDTTLPSCSSNCNSSSQNCSTDCAMPLVRVWLMTSSVVGSKVAMVDSIVELSSDISLMPVMASGIERRSGSVDVGGAPRLRPISKIMRPSSLSSSAWPKVFVASAAFTYGILFEPVTCDCQLLVKWA